MLTSLLSRGLVLCNFSSIVCLQHIANHTREMAAHEVNHAENMRANAAVAVQEATVVHAELMKEEKKWAEWQNLIKLNNL